MEGVGAKGAADAQAGVVEERGIMQRQQIDYDMGKAIGTQKVGADASGLQGGGFTNQFAESAINRANALASSQYATNIQKAQLEGEGKAAMMSGIMGGITTAAEGTQGTDGDD
jgi:hypothetical protein